MIPTTAHDLATTTPGLVAHPGHAMLDAMAWLIRAARRAMLLESPRRPAAEWNLVRVRLQDASDSCKMRLPLGGADYLENFTDEVRVLIGLVGMPAKRSLYAAIAMIPAIRRSMREDDATTERATT